MLQLLLVNKNINSIGKDIMNGKKESYRIKIKKLICWKLIELS